MVSILGIDPGSRCTGYGVIHDGLKGPVLVAYGTIRTDSDDFPTRLKQIYDGLYAVAREYRPTEAAIEQVFMSKNADSALKLGQARGAAICAAMNAGLPVREYAARQVKQALVGKGGAEKSQVQHMVRFLLSIKEVLPADASDALGIAMCHIHHRQTHLRMAQAAMVRR
ncbi:MAG: crossover junction endodeoxyribonuclease RuvC [Gammaproteobacteria bacterium]|nr:crossover junction endodeoxyribonuclease RuvC [Gammaproteobacteria bacterium]NBT43794.1 crossover junction endodeoxyribonuclease RuvC [Gammaproteobacteria bacterium]NBY23699.1 crossover junction endodeoxyribonuclease RuvC [Gammaproteobacteria bacterium]NDE33757.1 crossover junction endodeoxyribonuclease RuvC [Gammaproteobacteria bacterium]NDE56273.1 crossover junction endodeoxyribonuclease RuvC [Gammaproteobacteria bacterium]